MDDLEGMDDAEFAALLGPGESLVPEEHVDPPEPAKVSKPPRFFCAGSKRIDPYTEKKVCDYKAYTQWQGTCPKCGIMYKCLPFRRGANATTRVTLGQETMSAAKDTVYYSTGIAELDKVLGGGVVYEKTLLLGSPRGSGKTSILLQACDGFARDGRKAYFASGEMTRDACIAYAKRLGIVNENIGLFGDPEGVDVEDLFEDVLAFGAEFLVIDSIQVASVGDVKGDIGQPTMMDAVANMVTSFAQKKKRAVAMISHLSKSGDYAGSEKVQHLVDGLLRLEIKYVEGDDGVMNKDIGIREISMDGKSRQGRADVTAIVEMTDAGIKPPSMKALRALSKLHVVG